MKLGEVMQEDHIVFKESVDNYEEAINESGKILLKKGIIERKYLDKVINNVRTIGPYIVIAPMVALSHARPEDGVNELGMSLLMLERPVNFSEEKEKYARAIITLAAPNEYEHIEILSQMSKMLMENMDAFLAAKDKKTIMDMMQHYA